MEDARNSPPILHSPLGGLGGAKNSTEDLDRDRLGALLCAKDRDILKVERVAHVRYDPVTGAFEGLPPEWQSALDLNFGNPLLLYKAKTMDHYNHRIPAVLLEMQDYLKRERTRGDKKLSGLAFEGIFRVAPSKVEAETVLNELNHGKYVFNAEQDPHCFSNCIKVWFRSLPAPLLPDDPNTLLYSKIENFQAGDEVWPHIQTLKEPNQSVLLWLLDLCVEVAALEEMNRMTPCSLGVVIAPNIYRSPDVDLKPNADPAVVARVVDRAMKLSRKMVIFLEDAIKYRIANPPERPKSQSKSRAASNVESFKLVLPALPPSEATVVSSLKDLVVDIELPAPGEPPAEQPLSPAEQPLQSHNTPCK